MSKQLKDKEFLRHMSVCIKQIRNEKNVTLESFYFDTGIHLARIEQGKLNISVSTLSKICDYFSIDLSDFFKRLEEIKLSEKAQ